MISMVVTHGFFESLDDLCFFGGSPPWLRIHGAGIYANIYWGYIDGIHVTLWWTNIAIENGHWNSGFSH